MSRPTVFQWIAFAGLFAFCAGCETFSSGLKWPTSIKDQGLSSLPPDQRSQREWWNENSEHKVFVPGRGYQIEGVAGYFDAKGRPINGPIQRSSYAQITDLDKPPEEEASDSILGSLDPAVTAKRVRAATGQGPDQTRAKQFIAEADDLFRQKKYGAAASKYAKAADRWPGTNLAEDAMMMQAESYFFAAEYPKAVDVYQELIKDFPSTQHLDKVMRRQFEIARYWQKAHTADPKWMLTPNLTDETQHWTDTIGHAIRAYDHIRINDPTGPLADQALMATASAYFQRERYIDADYHFGLLRREYPSSKFQYQAHLLGLQCKLKLYQGPEYDGTMLEEADKIAEQLMKQFSKELSESSERERVSKLRQELAAQQALRLWTRSKFYEGRSEYRSARTYWKKIVDKYPGTKLAHEAETRLKKTQNEPDEPERKAEWLVKLFDEEDTPKPIATRPNSAEGETIRK